MKLENDLGKDNIRRIVLRIALPSMLAQFVSVLYSIVDRMYIGHMADAGDLALAGVGVSGPIVTLVGAFACLVGMGGLPLMSLRMGEGNNREAQRILANCFLMLCVISAVLTPALLLMKEPMLRLFGASELTYPYANDYFTIYILGTVFALLSSGMNQFIIGQGYAKVGMFAVVIGAVSNIVLDPIFIYLFRMGVRGAALATVLSQMLSCMFVLRFLFDRSVPVPICFGGYRWSIIRRVLLLGLSPFFIIAIDNIMIIMMNAVLQHYGGAQGDMLVTCATIAQSLMLVVTMPLGGITGSTQTILAYNYGAGQTGRVLSAQRYIILLGIIYTTVLFVLVRICGGLFVGLFTTDPVIASESMRAIRICTLAIIPLAVQYEIVDGFTALGFVQYALPLSMFRKIVYFAALFLLPLFFEARDIFFAETISDLFGPAISAIVYFCCVRRLMARRERRLNLQK